MAKTFTFCHFWQQLQGKGLPEVAHCPRSRGNLSSPSYSPHACVVSVRKALPWHGLSRASQRTMARWMSCCARNVKALKGPSVSRWLVVSLPMHVAEALLEFLHFVFSSWLVPSRRLRQIIGHSAKTAQNLTSCPSRHLLMTGGCCYLEKPSVDREGHASS